MPASKPPEELRTAIIDIGSNSIRLVVYQGSPRLPAILFNEKVLAGLGRSLSQNGRIDKAALDAARQAITRFARLAREMEVPTIRTVATAAVRDASNGDELLRVAAEAGLSVTILSGDDEAHAAGMGVISAVPEADGVVGDLGGGSLELARVKKGEVHDRASFPIGVLRLAALRRSTRGDLPGAISRLLGQAGWREKGRGLPLYLVGGSWRALTRLEMDMAKFPVPVIHQHSMTSSAVDTLIRQLGQSSRAQLKAVPGLSSGRVPTLEDAAELLGIVLRELGSSGAIASAYGLREGLLYGALDTATRAQDPLIVAARDEGRRLGRFPEHGDLLDAWIAPLFVGEPPAAARLRKAACQLADVGWRANPDFRAERGLETALHGNWVGIDTAGRAQLAQALWTSLGGSVSPPSPLPDLASPSSLTAAAHWGLALRLAQRMSGGLAGPLRRSRMELHGEAVTLRIAGEDRPLYGEAVIKRHLALANALGRVPAILPA